MSAKPQPMAGQSDAADDLIAELAKLMAQDAKGDRPADATTQPFSVRIPGAAAPTLTPTATPAPRFDFDRTVALATDQAAPAAVHVAASDPIPTPTSGQETPEPFRFDFDLPTTSRPPVEQPPAAAPATAVEVPEAGPAIDHDSIADLIAAEFADDPAPAAVAEPPAAEPVAVAPEPVAAAPERPAPQSGAVWMPTTVAANLGGQERPVRAPLRALNLHPTVRSEQDRFKVPPVFGLGSKAPEPSVSPVPSPPSEPVAAEPLAMLRQPAMAVVPEPEPQDDGLGRDPIDEIEDLIGRAMRVEFDRPAEAAADDVGPAPSPALRSLATPLPTATPAASPSAPRALSGADEAILAAAQATGAEIGWVEAPEVDELEPAGPAMRPRARRSFGLTRAFAGPLVAVTLLLAAGFGLYWVLGLGRDTGPAPLLTADTTPIKETPAVQPDATASQQSVVFNEINGVVPGAEEQLVSRDQADVNEVTQVPPSPELSEEGLANRKVRTVTVRPDGTIVSGEESVAGSTILPVDRPNVPEVPGAETASPELLAAAQPGTAAPVAAAAPETTPTPEAEAVAATPAVTPVTPGSTVPAVDAAGNLLAGKTAPVPVLRPSNLQASAPTATPGVPVTAVVDTPGAGSGNLLPPPPTNSALGALTPQPAATQPVAAAAQPSAAIPGALEVEALPDSAPAYAQLASLRSEEEAREAAQRLVTRFGPLFGGANMEVQRVDLGARGIYYRVRVPAQSAEAASNICTNVVAAGGDCVLM